MSEHVATNLRNFRDRLGWTQERLAAIAGVATRTVQRAERDGVLSADTLQAFAAAFDMSIEELRRPLLTEQEIAAAVADAVNKYKLTQLVPVERSSDLSPFMGADAWQVDHVGGLSEAEEDDVAVLKGLIQDYGDIWSHLGGVEQRDAVKTIFETVDRLRASGLCVAAGSESMPVMGPNFKEPLALDVLRVLVSRADDPKLLVAREKGAPVRFV